MNFNTLSTAIITPLQDDKVHYGSLAKILDIQLQCGVENIVLLGTTAECTLLTYHEHNDIINFAKQYVGNRCCITVGIGTASTKTTACRASKVTQLGADAVMVVAPYYTKCTSNGLMQHFEAVARNTNLPIIAYNVPHRTGYTISTADIVHLYQCGLISALKQADNSMAQTKQLSKLCDMPIICGNDNQIARFQALGYKGCISVLSNVYPTLVRQIYTNRAMERIATKLLAAMSCQLSPVAIKYIAYKLGIITTPQLRLPLTQLEQVHCKAIDNMLCKYSGVLLCPQ